jgi:tetratricopeptide (TPR) repeat protein
MHRRNAVGVGLVALALSSGCSSREGGPATSSWASASWASQATRSAPEAPAISPERLARDAEAAMTHLAQALAQTERWLEREPSSLEAREALVDLLLRRAQALGKVSDLDRLLALADEMVEQAPARGRSFVVRARALAAVHRFSDALDDLDRAEALGVSRDDTRSQRGTIAMGLGRYDEALRSLELHRKKFDAGGAMVLEAAALGRVGRFDEADALFERARRSARAPSPFALAWLRFEQAAMWERAGDDARARRLYQQVLAVLPHHAHAAAHLAATLPPKQAEALLTRVTEIGDDPELFALLADARERLAPGSGRSARARALEGYEGLIAQHPLAFADHAGWFYLAEGQLDRAVELGEQNLAARPVPEAYQLAIATLLRAGETDEACRTAERSLSLSHRGPALEAVAVEAFAACGRSERAAGLRRH